MTAVAEGRFVFSEEGLEQVEQRLDDVRKKANKLLAQLPKELQKQIKDMGRAMGEELKSMVPAVMNSLQGAVTAPAKSTFAQVIAEANRARRDASLIAVSTGKDVADVNAQIQGAARMTREMPASVVAWSRSVRQLTGDWQGALNSMSAMKDVALALDVPIESLVGSSARLRNSFGLKSQEDVAKFFGTMNAQATAAGTTFERSARQFMTFQDSFGHMSSKGAGAFSGLSAAFAASSKDPEQAIRNQSFGMGVLNSGVRQIEHRMGKGFSITNTETGEVDPKKYLEAMKFLQKDMVKYYGSKKRAIQVQAGDDLEARRDVGGFLNADLSKVNKLEDLPPEQLKAMERYTGLDAGKRDLSDVKKNIKDQEAGAPLLKAQDKAVELGGGAAGIAMEHASGLFSTAVDRFGGIVANMAGAVVGRGASATGTIAATATGSLVSSAGKLAASGAGQAALLAGTGYAAYQAGSMADEALGISDKISNQLAKWFVPGYEENTPSDTSNGVPREVALSPATHRAAAEAQAAALANRTLRVQIVPVTEAPQSQPPPR